MTKHARGGDHVAGWPKPKRSVRSRIVITLGLIAALALLVVATAVVRFANLRPTITRNYFNELKARLDQIPEDQRMRPAIERVHAAWRAYLADHPGFENVFIGDTRPGDKNWEAAVAMVEAQAGLIEELREASNRPSMGGTLELASAFEIRYHDNPPLVLASTSPLSASRTAVRMLQQSFQVRLHRGDFAGAIDDVCAIVRIGEKSVTVGTSIEQLVAFAAANNAVGMVREDFMPLAREIPDSQLQRLRTALAGFSFVPGKPLRVLVDFERKAMADVLQRVYSDDGNGDGWLLATEFEELFPSLQYGVMSGRGRARPVWRAWQFPMAMWADTRKATVEKLENRLAEGERLLDQPPALWSPLPRRSPGVEDPFTASMQFQGASMVADVVSPMFLAKMAEIQWMTRQLLSGIDVGFAIEAYRKRTGGLPSTLDELVPRDLAEVPIDVFDGKPIKYIATEGQPRVYTVGVDGIDHKCEESWSESSGWWGVASKDIILYPHVGRPHEGPADRETNE